MKTQYVKNEKFARKTRMGKTHIVTVIVKKRSSK